MDLVVLRATRRNALGPHEIVPQNLVFWSRRAPREASRLGRHGGWRSVELQLLKSGDGDGDGQSTFGVFFAVLNGVDEHLDGLSGIGRNKDGRGQEPGAHPGLAGL